MIPVHHRIEPRLCFALISRELRPIDSKGGILNRLPLPVEGNQHRRVSRSGSASHTRDTTSSRGL